MTAQLMVSGKNSVLRMSSRVCRDFTPSSVQRLWNCLKGNPFQFQLLDAAARRRAPFLWQMLSIPGLLLTAEIARGQ